MKSIVTQGSRVAFPVFLGERIYMRKFTKAVGLPDDLKRWQDTVDQMLDGVHAPKNIFLMVDQAPVLQRTTHRRPGLHVDGYWEEALSMHRGDTPGHRQDEEFPPGRHGPRPDGLGHIHAKRERGDHGTGHRVDPRSSELLILASDVYGCDAYQGAVAALPGVGGDCSHLDEGLLERIEMEPGKAWMGRSIDFIHKSVPLKLANLRTVVRLNVQQ